MEGKCCGSVVEFLLACRKSWVQSQKKLGVGKEEGMHPSKTQAEEKLNYWLSVVKWKVNSSTGEISMPRWRIPLRQCSGSTSLKPGVCGLSFLAVLQDHHSHCWQSNDRTWEFWFCHTFPVGNWMLAGLRASNQPLIWPTCKMIAMHSQSFWGVNLGSQI